MSTPAMSQVVIATHPRSMKAMIAALHVLPRQCDVEAKRRRSLEGPMELTGVIPISKTNSPETTTTATMLRDGQCR